MKIKALDREGKLVCVLVVKGYNKQTQRTIDLWMAEHKRHHPCGSFIIA